ncbi:CLUMA_CG017239, isoform A [Clunio marinus]|uniref:CLUMA_CG017239, isoform A n=1 Tax=Clunio marinus TaxID=568069 RepID=A0A1J1IVC8_9DIPT|nr:CLUMA_CG017239, isoform A [Clunio marinus]
MHITAFHCEKGCFINNNYSSELLFEIFCINMNCDVWYINLSGNAKSIVIQSENKSCLEKVSLKLQTKAFIKHQGLIS